MNQIKYNLSWNSKISLKRYCVKTLQNFAESPESLLRAQRMLLSFQKKCGNFFLKEFKGYQ